MARPEHAQGHPGHRRARPDGGVHQQGRGASARSAPAATRSTPTRSRSSASSSTGPPTATPTGPSCTSSAPGSTPARPFGGRIDNVQDPQTGLIITLRVFGEYSLQVVDPNKLILNLTGTVERRGQRRRSPAWIERAAAQGDAHRGHPPDRAQRLADPRPLGLHARDRAAVIEAANAAISDYGITIVRMGNFDVNLAEEDEERLKGLAKDVSYTRLAGGFQQYAAGEALLGAGEGMAKGGGAVQGAFLAAGLGFGQQMAAPPPPQQQRRRRWARRTGTGRRRRPVAGRTAPTAGPRTPRAPSSAPAAAPSSGRPPCTAPSAAPRSPASSAPAAARPAPARRGRRSGSRRHHRPALPPRSPRPHHHRRPE